MKKWSAAYRSLSADPKEVVVQKGDNGCEKGHGDQL